ncbi:MAG: hypothetical protein AAGA93_25205 [Actinomycetota bacterium]
MTDVGPTRGRRGGRLATSLLAIAFVLLVVAGPMLYTATVIDDEDAFVALSDDVIAHPEIRRAVAGATVTITIEAVANDETISQALPDIIRPLTVPVTSLATAELTDVAFRLLDTGAAVEARQSALREVHRQLTADDDEIVIDLRAVLVRTSRELGGPAIGAGVAKFVTDEGSGRFTLVEADSPNADLLAIVRAVPAVGALTGLVGLLALVAAVLVAPDRRRILVLAGLVLAGAALTATVVVGFALFAVLGVVTGGSTVGVAVAEVVAADFAEQQRGSLVTGLVVAIAGVALGRSRSAVALRALPGDLWHRRRDSIDRLAELATDNPPLSRLVIWLAGAAALQVWSAPTWRVVLTIVAMVAAAQWFAWMAAAPSDRARRIRADHGLPPPPVDPDPLGAPGRVNVNVGIAAVAAFLLWPGWDRRLVITFLVVGAVAQALADLPTTRTRLRANRADEPVGVEPVGPTNRRRLTVALAVGALAVVAGTVSTLLSAEETEAAVGCNGHEELCDRRIDEVVFAGSHNAMSSSDLGWDLALQTGDMVTQLDHGIRALLIDALYWDDDGQLDGGAAAGDAATVIEAALGDDQPRPGTWLCHGFCALGATDLVAGLTEIDVWLDEHPREVLLIVVQDEITFDDLQDAFVASGLRDRAHAHQPGEPFPTLGELIDRDERILVYGENQGERGQWFQNAYDTAFTETPFTFAVANEFSCEPNRGDAANPLFLINHWITTGIPVQEAAITINDRASLLDRVDECEEERARRPTVLAVDFVETGDLVDVVDELNGVGG